MFRPAPHCLPPAPPPTARKQPRDPASSATSPVAASDPDPSGSAHSPLHVLHDPNPVSVPGTGVGTGNTKVHNMVHSKVHTNGHAKTHSKNHTNANGHANGSVHPNDPTEQIHPDPHRPFAPPPPRALQSDAAPPRKRARMTLPTHRGPGPPPSGTYGGERGARGDEAATTTASRHSGTTSVGVVTHTSRRASAAARLPALPDEVLVAILQHVPRATHLARLRAVCAQWRRVIDSTPAIWRHVSFRGAVFAPRVCSAARGVRERRRGARAASAPARGARDASDSSSGNSATSSPGARRRDGATPATSRATPLNKRMPQPLRLREPAGAAVVRLAARAGNPWARFLQAAVFDGEPLRAFTALQPLASMLVGGAVAGCERPFAPGKRRGQGGAAAFGFGLGPVDGDGEGMEVDVDEEDDGDDADHTAADRLAASGPTGCGAGAAWYGAADMGAADVGAARARRGAGRADGEATCDGWVAVHAARRMPRDAGRADDEVWWPKAGAAAVRRPRAGWPRGAVVGLVHVATAAVRADGQSRWVWEIDGAVKLARPLRCAGFLGLWTMSTVLSDLVIAAVHEQQ